MDKRNRSHRLAFHESETEKVWNLPFPAGAVVLEPMMMLTNLTERYSWFHKKWCPYQVGDVFYENINQGDRPCRVLAVDEESGNYLYDYEMPNGRVFHRINGRSVNPKRLSKKWKALE